MKNDIGVFLAKLQKETGETADEMAKKLRISRGFYFAVCNGRKKCPDKWFELIPHVYKLDDEKRQEWIGAIIGSNHRLDWIYDKLNDADKDLVFTLANYIDNMEPKQKEAIREIINNR
ncbi:MAG: hypothetical protein LBL34_05435 [Clostridiales bacterium]|nr:hypothetical protein [Clostridiales bacterium]